MVEHLGLGDDVELAALPAQQGHVAQGLEPGTEPALGLADALDDGAHLAVARRHQRHDPVGLTETHGSQHDPLVPVQAHGSGAARRATAPGSRAGWQVGRDPPAGGRWEGPA